MAESAGDGYHCGRILAALAGCIACAHHPVSTVSSSPPSLSGNYRFVEQPVAMNKPIAGGIVIRGDTLIAVDDAGVCEYDAHASRHEDIVYHCGTVTLRFDRRDPIGKATYETTASIQSKQVICDNRQPRCPRARVEDSTVTRPLSGKLHLKRIDEPRSPSAHQE